MLKLTPSHSYLLDCLRGYSAQVVLLGHILIFFSSSYKEIHIYIQDYAIFVFFFISGFLISYTTLNKVSDAKFCLVEYFLSRFIRIYTVLVPTLFFVIFVDAIFYFDNYPFEENFTAWNFFSSLFLLNSFGEFFHKLTFFQPLGSLRPLWTLSIEWVIYMFYGLLLSCFLGRGNKLKVILLILFLPVPFVHIFTTKLSLIWFSGWFSSYLLYSNKSISDLCLEYRKHIRLLLILSALSFPFFVVNFEAFSWKSIIYTILLLVLTFAFSFGTKPSTLQRINTFSFASFSYTLYLTHYTILQVIYSQKYFSQPLYAMVFAFFICNIFAYFFHIPFEIKLFNYLKKRSKNAI